MLDFLAFFREYNMEYKLDITSLIETRVSDPKLIKLLHNLAFNSRVVWRLLVMLEVFGLAGKILFGLK